MPRHILLFRIDKFKMSTKLIFKEIDVGIFTVATADSSHLSHGTSCKDYSKLPLWTIFFHLLCKNVSTQRESVKGPTSVI